MNQNNFTIFIPNMIISLIVLSILLSPIISIKPLHLWQVIPAFTVVLCFNRLRINYKSYCHFIPLFLYVIFSGLVLSFLDRESVVSISRKVLLFSVSIGVLFLVLSLYRAYVQRPEKLVSLINSIIWVVCLYGIYQFFGRKFGWPFTMDDFVRYRPYQINSFFYEPAFFSQFLVTMLYIQVFFLKFRYRKIIFLVTINLILAMSVGGYVTMVTIYFLWFYRYFLVKKSSKKLKVFLWLTFFLCIIIVVFGTEFFIIMSRIMNTFIYHSDRSGQIRVFGELETLKNVILSKYAILGMGISYENILSERTMGLNALVEFLVRWGLFGLMLYAISLYSEISRNSHKNVFSLVVFLLLFFQIDGAIAKSVFWFLIGILFLFGKLDAKNCFDNSQTGFYCRNVDTQF